MITSLSKKCTLIKPNLIYFNWVTIFLHSTTGLEFPLSERVIRQYTSAILKKTAEKLRDVKKVHSEIKKTNLLEGLRSINSCQILKRKGKLKWFSWHVFGISSLKVIQFLRWQILSDPCLTLHSNSINSNRHTQKKKARSGFYTRKRAKAK